MLLVYVIGARPVVTGGIQEQFPPDIICTPQMVLFLEKFVLNV